MSTTRREFMKDAAVAGAVAATGSMAAENAVADGAENEYNFGERCPYFDQPLHCKGMTESGKCLCDE